MIVSIESVEILIVAKQVVSSQDSFVIRIRTIKHLGGVYDIVCVELCVVCIWEYFANILFGFPWWPEWFSLPCEIDCFAL